MGIDIRGVQAEANSLSGRFNILWCAIKNLFTGRGIQMIGLYDVSISSDLNINISMFMKRENENWKQHVITYDGSTEECTAKSTLV